ncbi:MAG: PAS domain S-box protein [Bacteroidales bacterium]|nr:PAS domain S-box protein [Bacteroidales bacterium]
MLLFYVNAKDGAIYICEGNKACLKVNTNGFFLKKSIVLSVNDLKPRISGNYYYFPVYTSLKNLMALVVFYKSKRISSDFLYPVLYKIGDELERRRLEFLILDNIGIQVWYLKDAQIYGLVNKVCANFFGREKKEMENKNPAVFFHKKEEADVHIKNNQEVFESKRQTKTKEWITNSKGERRLICVTRTPKLDINDEVEYVICHAEDITVIQKQKELQKSENHIFNLVLRGEDFNKILDNIAFIIEQFDPSIKACIMLLDEETEKLYLASAPNLPDEYNYLLKEEGMSIGPNIGSCGSAAYYKSKIIATDIENDLRWLCLGDIYRIALKHNLRACWSEPIIDSNGEIVGTIANYSDQIGPPSEDAMEIMSWSAGIMAIIIERRKAEDLLYQQKRQLNDILESQQDLVIRFNNETQLTYVNKAYCETFGESKDEITGQLFNPKKIPGAIGSFERVLSGQKIINLETEVYTVNGFKILSWEMYPIFDNKGNIIEGQAVGRDVTKQRLAEKELKKSYNKIYKLSREILKVQEEERRRLAADLHDETSQALTMAKMELQRINARTPINLNHSIQLLQKAINNIRYQITSLRPPFLEGTTLKDAIDDLIYNICYYSDLTVEVNSNGFEVTLPEEIETILYRCIQESLTNIIRHSHATKAQINLKNTSNAVFVSIVDDGVGFDLAAVKNTNKIGLTSMKERVEVLGGELEVFSAYNKGTTISIKIPNKLS